MAQFDIVQMNYFSGNICLSYAVDPLNNLVPMKNCPLGKGGWGVSTGRDTVRSLGKRVGYRVTPCNPWERWGRYRP